MFRSILIALTLTTSAFAGDKGVTPTEIRLGASAVLSGPLGPQTRDYGVGSRLYFDAVNAAGGVHGRKISYVTLDDGFEVKRALENTRKLIEDDGNGHHRQRGATALLTGQSASAISQRGRPCLRGA